MSLRPWLRRPPPADDDPSERRIVSTPRAEAITAALLFAAAAFAVAFGVLYVVDDATTLLGATAGLSLACLAAALLWASLRVVPQVTEVEERAPLDQGPEAHAELADDLRAGGEGISRRGLLVGAAGACGCGLVVVAGAPLASLGPRIEDRLASSPWRRGRLLVDEDDRPIAADSLEVGGTVTAFPQGADKRALGAPVAVVRVREDELRMPPQRRAWTPQGLVAYSRICTHAGCSVTEFRYPHSPTTAPGGPALVCPCHYSTFDVTNGAKVEFGPAGRPLPQLPLAIDAKGLLRAGGGLSGAPGPAWWGVGH